MKRSCAFLRLRRSILVTAVLLGFCAAVAHAEGPQKPLNVVLFPYIPDAAHDGFTKMKNKLQNDFKLIYDRTAVITIDPNLDLYNMDTLGKLLNDQSEVKDSLADVVEIDTLLLGQLVDLKWVGPLKELELPPILPNAEAAREIKGEVYAAPTYLCTNVVYTQSQERIPKGAEDLGKFLTSLPLTPLAGNFKGSLTLSPAYLDAWADTHCKEDGINAINACTKNLGEEVSKEVDQDTMGYFRPLVETCAIPLTPNPCLSGTYKDNHVAENVFAAQRAKGYFGFTEGLFYILSALSASKENLPPLNVISAPLGKESHPVMFVDALVVRKGCALDPGCFERAKVFIKFMSTSFVRELIALSKDAGPNAIPRYLLQANQVFYDLNDIKGNPYYPRLKAIIDKAAPFPNDVKDAVSPPRKPNEPEQPGAYSKLSKAVLKSLTEKNPPN